MGKFFDKFPKISYNMSGNKYPEYQIITNILFRTAFVRDVLTNSSSYIRYIVRDGDTPEIIATKVYGDPEAHWLILYANEMIDAQYDWPMTDVVFSKYMADKYRSMAEDDLGGPLDDYQVISWTQDRTNNASVHHYEKVVKNVNLAARTTNEERYIINKSKLTDNELDVPFDYYDDLAEEQDVTPINLSIQGQTVIQTVYRNFVTYYDYELELNESRRNIRIIKKEYYSQILSEFSALTGTPLPSFIRRVA